MKRIVHFHFRIAQSITLFTHRVQRAFDGFVLCCCSQEKFHYITALYFLSLSFTHFSPFLFLFLVQFVDCSFRPLRSHCWQNACLFLRKLSIRKPDSTVGGDVSAPVALLLHRPHLVAGNWLFPDVRSADAENMAVS